VVICPLGFTSDHMEVMYDLDTEAQELATNYGCRWSGQRQWEIIRGSLHDPRADHGAYGPVAPRRALGDMGQA